MADLDDISSTHGNGVGVLSSLQWMPLPLDHTRHDHDSADGPASDGPASDEPRTPTLFWDQPPWHRWPSEVAVVVAAYLERHRIPFAALWSELGVYAQSELRKAQKERAPGDESLAEFIEQCKSSAACRIVPCRNERYGLHSEDFDHAGWIDWRLSPPRNPAGRYAYTADQVARWEGTPEEEPLAGGGWIAAMGLPPDLPDLSRSITRVKSLRALSQACVLVSLDGMHSTELGRLVADSSADGMVLRFQDSSLSGTSMLRRLAEFSTASGPCQRWVHPVWADADTRWQVDDAAKLVGLGIDAVAMDPWMEDACDALAEVPPRSAYSPDSMQRIQISVVQILDDFTSPFRRRFTGLTQACQQPHESTWLGSTDESLASHLRIETLLG